MFPNFGRAIMDFLRRADTQRLLRRNLQIVLANPTVRRGIQSEIGRGVDVVAEFWSSIRIKIEHRKTETQFVINVSAYVAKNIRDSTVVMGEGLTVKKTINEVTLTVRLHPEDVCLLQDILDELNVLDARLGAEGENKDRITREYLELKERLRKVLSRATDYKSLRSALRTEDEE